MFKIGGSTKIVLGIVAVVVFLLRGITMVSSLHAGKEAELLAFPFTVIFPAILIVLLLRMEPTKTREGLLMRIGTLIQLLLIISLPGFALHLALGFPFVFLAVEFFETRLPKRLTTPLIKLFLS